jgi:hypothetical protein
MILRGVLTFGRNNCSEFLLAQIEHKQQAAGGTVQAENFPWGS